MGYGDENREHPLFLKTLVGQFLQFTKFRKFIKFPLYRITRWIYDTQEDRYIIFSSIADSFIPSWIAYDAENAPFYIPPEMLLEFLILAEIPQNVT